MNRNKLKLTPVKREDFKENFGSNSAMGKLDPEAYYQSTIEHIEKMAVGPFFWFIADVISGIALTSGGMIDKLLPLTNADFQNKKPDKLFGCMHPEDMPKLFAFTNYWVEFFMDLPEERKKMFRPTIYIRMMNPHNIYNWVMVQYLDSVYDETGVIGYGLTLVTDISHIKKDGVAMMSVLDHFTNKCEVFFCSDGRALPDSKAVIPTLTKREIEIVRLLAAGRSSKQMASELGISAKTVHNHRQNLLKKTNVASTAELVAFSINHGFI